MLPFVIAPALIDSFVALLAAAGAGWVARRIGLDAVWGYLLAGIALGPFTPGYSIQPGTVQAFANGAIALLLFGFGLTFARGRATVYDGLAVAANAALLVLLAIPLSLLAVSLGLQHPLAVAVTGGLAALGIASALLRVRHTAPSAVFTRSLSVPIVRDTLAIALLIALACSSTEPSRLAIVLALEALLVGAGLIAGPATIGFLSRRFAFIPPRFRLWTLVLPLIGAAAVVPHLGIPAGAAAFVIGLVLSRRHEAPELWKAVVPLRAAIGLFLFIALGASLNPEAVTKHAMLLVAVFAVGAAVVAIAARRRPLGTASATLTIALVPFADFHAAIGSAALFGYRSSDVEQAIVSVLLLLAIVAAIALCSLSLPRSSPNRAS